MDSAATELDPISAREATTIYRGCMNRWHILERFPQPDWSIVDLWVARHLLSQGKPAPHIQAILRLASPVEVNQVMQFDNIQTIKEAVALGSGISILPERTMQTEIDQGRLISVPLHAPGLLRPLGIVHRKRKRFNLAAQAFLNLLREQPAAQAS